MHDKEHQKGSLLSAMDKLITWALEERTNLSPQGVSFDFDDFRTATFTTGEPVFPDLWPEHGAPLAEVIDQLLRHVFPANHLPGHPRYFSYLAGGTNNIAAVGHVAGDMLNSYSAHAALAPASVALERSLIGWLCSQAGLGNNSYGWLTTGSSLAILVALNAFRNRSLKNNAAQKLHIIFSEEAHHAVSRMAHFAGFPASALQQIPVDSKHRMDLEALAISLSGIDHKRESAFVVATAGTTTLGRVENIAAIADLCQEYACWLHVDAAYGFAFSLLEQCHERLSAMCRANSINLDFHKAFSLPYGTGALLVSSVEDLQIPHWHNGSYMPPQAKLESGVLLDPADFAPELTRDNRGLRVWMTLRCKGIAGIRNDLNQAMANARWIATSLEQEIGSLPGVEVLPPELSVVGILVPHDRILPAILARRQVALSGCRVGNRPCIRICSLSDLTTQRDLDICVSEVVKGVRAF